MGRALKPEDWIAHYRVKALLGAGGMGEVYRARDQSLERDVALKVLPPEVVTNEERVRRFTQEAKSASSLNHPHIVHIYEIGEDQVRGAESPSAPLHYIAMELVQGETLSAKIHNKQIELKTLLGWLAQAAEGVAKAHAAGIAHRDLKPGNIMVSDDGYAKVLDFGLAKLMEGKGPESGWSTAPTRTVQEQTHEGVVLGTVGYMAPEQVRGQPVDARADVFAFGCMLYEAATRQRPFAADSNVETLHRILNDIPTPVEQVNPKVPAELGRLIRRCLAKDPNQRPQSMRDLALELRDIVENYDKLSTSPSSGSVSTAPPTRQRQIRLTTVLIALFVTAAVIAGLIMLLPQGPPRLNSHMKARNIALPFKGSIGAIALSPDGHWIVLSVQDERDVWTLYLMNSRGGDARSIVVDSTANLISGAAISPDGSQVVYLARRGMGYSSDIRVVSTLGGTPRVVSHGGFRVQWSPDGQRIGYILNPLYARQSRYEFWTVRPDGSQPVREFVDSTSVFGSTPEGFSWSPNGRLILWLKTFANSTYNEIVIHDLATGHERQVTHDRKLIDSVWWMPNDEIVFSSNRQGATNLWVARVGGGAPAQVTRGGGPDELIGVSSDGRTLLYGVSRQLTTAGWWNVETGESGYVTKDESFTGPLAPSPDGKQVLLRSPDPTSGWLNSEIVVMSRDGTGRHRIATEGESPMTYDWSPDGRHIAWDSVHPGPGDSLIRHLADPRTGENQSTVVIPTQGSWGKMYWMTPDTIKSADLGGTLWYSPSQRRLVGRSNSETIYPNEVPGWTVLKHRGISRESGEENSRDRDTRLGIGKRFLYVRPIDGGPERCVMPEEWECGFPSETPFLYCWPESLGFRRLDLPSGRLTRVAHEPPEGKAFFFPNRDGRIVFWTKEHSELDLSLIEDFRQ